MKSRITSKSKLNIKQLEKSDCIKEIDNLEAAQIIGGRGYRYSGPAFQSGDETMARETIDIAYVSFQRLI